MKKEVQEALDNLMKELIITIGRGTGQVERSYLVTSACEYLISWANEKIEEVKQPRSGVVLPTDLLKQHIDQMRAEAFAAINED